MAIFNMQKIKDTWEKINKIYVLLLGLMLGLIIAYLATLLWPNTIVADVRSKSPQYKFINPLLECKNVAFENNNNLNAVKNKVKDMVNDAITENRIANASVYYRDLNVGPWFDVNRDEEYSPASLIKVPLMIAMYKLSETDPTFMEKTIIVDRDYNYENQNFKPKRIINKGETYTMKQLLERMIIDSDNFAYELVIENVDQAVVVQVYNDLDIDILKLNAEEPHGNILSLKDFPGFFRVLFNASYLSRKNSEEALELLSRSAYDQGLVAGTPADTIVAHKYGERYFSFSGMYQLHDCGIVYNKKSPYLLCIMTKGNNFEDLEEFIQSTTKIIDEAHTNTP